MEEMRMAHLRPLADDDFAVLAGRTILVTGGTGSFGSHFVRLALERSAVRRVVIYSRDELKQSRAQAAHAGDRRLCCVLGDVRDRRQLARACQGVDFIVHAAALKQVPTLEQNPWEAIFTNVVGARNVIDAALAAGVRRTVLVSTDKAVQPVNVYGATKMCAERLFLGARGRRSRFAVVRYGNVVGSRGSVVRLFLERRKDGVLPITDERMTRFWITLDRGAQVVLEALAVMRGGETFVPKIPSMGMLDLVRALAPDCRVELVGIRPGEKIHEVLMTEDEAARARDAGDCFIVEAAGGPSRSRPAGRYASDTSEWKLDPSELLHIVRQLGGEAAS
jgi:UDP-N-acetylglucosamine 4,6-dehydratase